jgi:hypothetical protein
MQDNYAMMIVSNVRFFRLQLSFGLQTRTTTLRAIMRLPRAATVFGTDQSWALQELVSTLQWCHQ